MEDNREKFLESVREIIERSRTKEDAIEELLEHIENHYYLIPACSDNIVHIIDKIDKDDISYHLVKDLNE